MQMSLTHISVTDIDMAVPQSLTQ